MNDSRLSPRQNGAAPEQAVPNLDPITAASDLLATGAGNDIGLRSVTPDRLSPEIVRAWGGGTMQPENLALDSSIASPVDLILRNFAATIGRKRYEHWFSERTLVWLEGDDVVVAVPTPFLVQWMSQNFRAGLLVAARLVLGEQINIRFEVRSEGRSGSSSESLAENSIASARVDESASLTHVSLQGDSVASVQFPSGRQNTHDSSTTIPKSISPKRLSSLNEKQNDKATSPAFANFSENERVTKAELLNVGAGDASSCISAVHVSTVRVSTDRVLTDRVLTDRVSTECVSNEHIEPTGLISVDQPSSNQSIGSCVKLRSASDRSAGDDVVEHTPVAVDMDSGVPGDGTSTASDISAKHHGRRPAANQRDGVNQGDGQQRLASPAKVRQSSVGPRWMDPDDAAQISPPEPVSLKIAVAAATSAATAFPSTPRKSIALGNQSEDPARTGARPTTAKATKAQPTVLEPVRQDQVPAKNSRVDNGQSSPETSVPASTASTTLVAKTVPAAVEVGGSNKGLQTKTALGDKVVTSVARVTKDSPLSIAKVKAVEEPPRNQRRFADLLDLVEGSCNEFALSAARQVCQAPGAQFTSLFVHGPVGVGKTHVLEGIHRELKRRYPARQVAYLTAEAFANFFTQALRDHKLPSFRQKFRSIDVLIVDDIDFLDGKRGIQEEFLFTVQQLEAHGRMVVVAAHGHPRLLTKMSEELRTRFLAGMVCRIDPPDVATRRRIIETKAFRAGADFAPDVFQFVADRFRNNVRELEGAFNTLLAHQRMQGRRLSLTAARHALADLERDCIRVVRIVDVEQTVCTFFGITNEDLKSTKRQQSISQPRMLAMYLARKHTRAAYTEIGKHFGGRNHSTVMAAEKKIKAAMTNAEPLQIQSQSWRISDLIESLEQQLQAS